MPSTTPSITDNHLDVLPYLATDKPAAEIAALLGLKKPTLDARIQDILRNARVIRLALAPWSLYHGYLSELSLPACDVSGLTPKQVELVRWLSYTGASDAALAQQFGWSARRVSLTFADIFAAYPDLRRSRYLLTAAFARWFPEVLLRDWAVRDFNLATPPDVLDASGYYQVLLPVGPDRHVAVVRRCGRWLVESHGVVLAQVQTLDDVQAFAAGRPWTAAHQFTQPLEADELELLRQCAAGRSTREIACARGLADPKPITSQLTAIFKALRVKSRAEAIAHLVGLGGIALSELPNTGWALTQDIFWAEVADFYVQGIELRQAAALVGLRQPQLRHRYSLFRGKYPDLPSDTFDIALAYIRCLPASVVWRWAATSFPLGYQRIRSESGGARVGLQDATGTWWTVEWREGRWFPVHDGQCCDWLPVVSLAQRVEHDRICPHLNISA